jgi:hypothetical protein
LTSTYVSYAAITRDLTQSLNRVSTQPQVQRESEYYLENIEKVKSIEDFIGNDRLYRYAMKAFGLEDMTYAKAFMVKVLKEGVTDTDSFANKLSDKRYQAFAETFDFARYGETTTVFNRTRQGTVDKFVRQTLEEDVGNQNEGVRLALYFKRKAPEITDLYSILADTALAKVVRTVLGMPDSFAMIDIDKQVELIGRSIDVEDFSDPKALEKLLTRFTSMWEIANPAASTLPNISILFSEPVEFGISTDVLMTLQQMKR